MKNILIIASIVFCTALQPALAQNRLFTKSGTVTFSAKGPIKNTRGENKKADCVLDQATGRIQVALLMEAFDFPRMIFKNVDYLESDKYPKAFFKGRIEDISEVNLSKDGVYPITMEGELTLHGITRHESAKGTVKVENGKMVTTAHFLVNLENYGVNVPGILADDKAVSIDLAAWFDGSR